MFTHIKLLFLSRIVLTLWDFSHGKFGGLSLGKASCNSCATQPTAHAGCFNISKIHWILTWTTGSLTWDVQTHVRESALKVDSRGKTPLPHWVTEPVSAACRSDILPTELHPCLITVFKMFQDGSVFFSTLLSKSQSPCYRLILCTQCRGCNRLPSLTADENCSVELLCLLSP